MSFDGNLSALTLTLSPSGRGDVVSSAEQARSTLPPLPNGERAGVRAGSRTERGAA
jgi:hypothetical protein